MFLFLFSRLLAEFNKRERQREREREREREKRERRARERAREREREGTRTSGRERFRPPRIVQKEERENAERKKKTKWGPLLFSFGRKRKKEKRLSSIMGLFRGRRGISILAGAMLVTGTLNTIATKLQVRKRASSRPARGWLWVAGGDHTTRIPECRRETSRPSRQRHPTAFFRVSDDLCHAISVVWPLWNSRDRKTISRGAMTRWVIGR